MRASSLLSCQNRWCLRNKNEIRKDYLARNEIRKDYLAEMDLLYLRLYARVYYNTGSTYSRAFVNAGSTYSRAFVTVEPSLQDTAVPASFLYCAEAR